MEFKRFVFNNKITKIINYMHKKNHSENILIQTDTKNDKLITLSKILKNETAYVVIERNQILIMDALMHHGGYITKYIDVNNNFSKYSEHAGALDFKGNVLSKIIVSGNTTNTDEEDDEIFTPVDMNNLNDYAYIFHTHPPTPKPGGRAKDGVLYEFPSKGDIYHFIDHHNDGNIIGSLVITAEGMYNIRKSTSDIGTIKINDNDLYKAYDKAFEKIQKAAILQYGLDFTTTTFFANIAQNVSYINKMNKSINRFNIHIDYYPRKEDNNGRWIIDTVFLVFRGNKSRNGRHKQTR